MQIILIAVSCPTLDPPNNGSIVITPGRYSQLGLGAIANYTCDPGFRINYFSRPDFWIRGCRVSQSVSETTGVWNSSAQSCIQGNIVLMYMNLLCRL